MGTQTDQPSFFQIHSDMFLEMALSAERLEKVENHDGYGKRTGECGDTVEIFLTIDNDIISALSFQLDGCMYTHACVNTVGNLVEGKRVEDAWEITPESVIELLETLPDEHHHCAELAVGALYLALNNYRELSDSSWKKVY